MPVGQTAIGVSIVVSSQMFMLPERTRNGQLKAQDIRGSKPTSRADMACRLLWWAAAEHLPTFTGILARGCAT